MISEPSVRAWDECAVASASSRWFPTSGSATNRPQDCCPWTGLPEYFGSWKGAHNRLRKWDADGAWEKVFTALLAQADAVGDLDWIVSVDSTIVGPTARRRGSSKGPGGRAGRPFRPRIPWLTTGRDR
ncbi:transposase [Streptomyces sp. SID5789]|nr:transposase [Streptomyces sp. SID5789]